LEAAGALRVPCNCGVVLAAVRNQTTNHRCRPNRLLGAGPSLADQADPRPAPNPRLSGGCAMTGKGIFRWLRVSSY